MTGGIKTQATRGDPDERERWKLILSRGLFRRGWSRDDILELYRFIDWIMALPEEHQRRHEATLEQELGEQAMTHMTVWERRGMEKGLKEGKEEGLKEGSLERAHHDVIQALEVRFGTVPEQVAAAVGALSNLDQLSDLHRQAIAADSLDAFAALLRERAAK